MAQDGCIPPTGDPLVGRVVRLDVMRPEDVEGLFAVYSDPVAYTQGYAMALPPATPAELQPLVRTATGARQPDGTGRTAYTIRLVEDSPLGAAGTIVGTSSLGDVDTQREHVHLGWTMYGSRWWGSAVNPESKFLLLAHAFETCGFGRVKLQTDVINARSRAAIVKLGATFEGVTRRDIRRADGTWRDSAVYSIIIDEWPAIRAALRARLS
ncbi:MAG TPA: GNAT family protein [Intrasporangium sp.]|jgi:Acetyltransferases, including N-acetylases of ribosomal proteins|uniref:GNAT family N-acetyltransferase n=1 Tax=Intrasporangium sp. TaxID=1925024 RepID=UPI002F93938C